ncbi:MAG: MFS transporter [Firmicutes bacterium]|nr:MFS transporter [Bacillota bacterium]
MSNSTEKLKNKEILSFALTNSGQGLIGAVVTTFYMLYLTDVLEIAPIITGALLVAICIFDAVTDPLMGVILDKSATRFGKCRPFMLFTPPMIAVCLILMFVPLPIGSKFAVVYSVIMFTVYTLHYTMNDIPYWSMSATITKDPQERVKLVSTTRLIGGGGSVVVALLFMTVISVIKPYIGLQNAYLVTATIYAVLGAIVMIQGYFNCKERIITPPRQSALKGFKSALKCRPLMLAFISQVLGAITFVGSVALNTYFVKWNLWKVATGGSDPFVRFITNLLNLQDPIQVSAVFLPIVGFLPAFATIVGLLFTPYFCKKFPKKNVLIVTLMTAGVLNIACYFLGYWSILIFMAGRFITSIPTGLQNGITTSMFGDAVDVLDHQTGERSEGICFSLLTFASKFSTGIAALVVGVILGLFAYDVTIGNQLEALVQAGNHEMARELHQPPSALNGIFLLVTVITGIGQILMAIPFFFYDLTIEKHKEILKALEARKQ